MSLLEIIEGKPLLNTGIINQLIFMKAFKSKIISFRNCKLLCALKLHISFSFMKYILKSTCKKHKKHKAAQKNYFSRQEVDSIISIKSMQEN